MEHNLPGQSKSTLQLPPVPAQALPTAIKLTKGFWSYFEFAFVFSFILFVFLCCLTSTTVKFGVMITCSARVLITFYPDTSTESHCPPCSFLAALPPPFLKYRKPSVKYVSFIAPAFQYFGNLGIVANLGYIVKQILLKLRDFLKIF